MTDTERIEQEKETLWEHERAQQALNAQTVKVQRLADKLENLCRALRDHPELVTGTPQIEAPDYRDDLAVLNREEILNVCHELARLKERARTTGKRVDLLRFGSPQSRVE